MTGFHMQVEDRTVKQMNDQPSGNLPFLKPDDIQYFDKLLVRILKKLYGIAETSKASLFCRDFNILLLCLHRLRWMSPH